MERQQMSERFAIIKGLKTLPKGYGTTPYITESMLLIVDWRFYAKNESAILDWLNTSKITARQKGMIMEFQEHSEMLAFLLRWAA
jgi:hypothetical protein